MVDENSTFGGFLTDIGEAKQANANALNIAWKITKMLLGDANGTDPVPAPQQTALIHEVYRADINQLFVDPANPGVLIAELVLPPNVGGWWIRELALEDEDGDFVAVANCAPSYKPLLAQGSGRNQVVRMHLIVSNTANVQLKIDPSVVLATRKYVDDQRAAHEAGRAHPLATDTERGMVIKASQEEVDAGTDDGKFVTARKLKAWTKAATESIAGLLKVATQEQVDAGEDGSTAVTPKKLRWGVTYSLGGSSGYLGFPSWLGGVIFQWGSATNLSTNTSVNFPIVFPSDCYLVLLGNRNTISSTSRTMVTVDPGTINTTLFKVAVTVIEGGSAAGNTYYLAIGK